MKSLTLLWLHACLGPFYPTVSQFALPPSADSPLCMLCVPQGVEFSQYMRDNGYHIIPIKPKHQLVGRG